MDTLADVHTKLDAWPSSHPQATPAELITARVLRDNVAALIRRNTATGRARTLAAADHAQQIFRA